LPSFTRVFRAPHAGTVPFAAATGPQQTRGRGQPLQNGPLTVQPCLSLPPDIKKAPLVVPTSIVTPSWFIACLRLLDHAPFCTL
jgi:hypothetical protein